MNSPWFVTDFDSSPALVRALSSSLHGRRFRRLGRGVIPGALTGASSILPENLRSRAFAIAGANEAIPPQRFTDITPDAFADWVTCCYPQTIVPAVAVGSSDGAVMHLCAAIGIPWLPQTFLVAVKRRAHPDDVDIDLDLGRRTVPPVVAAHRDLQVHQMHDANQDRLMVSRMAYFRLKMLSLPHAYRQFIARVLRPGGIIVIVDDVLRWPATQLSERHFFQAGAVGGLAPKEYLEGSPRVSAFLAKHDSPQQNWHYPAPDTDAPEAEWGYAPELTEDVTTFAWGNGYRVARVRIDGPGGTASTYVAELFRNWLSNLDPDSQRLLVETFIDVEPQWSLTERAIPFWQPFPTEPAATALAGFLTSHQDWREIAVTLFAHGTRSAGLADVNRWQQLADVGTARSLLAGVNSSQWPVDFASLARYSEALTHFSDAGNPAPRLSMHELRRHVERLPAPSAQAWEWLL